MSGGAFTRRGFVELTGALAATALNGGSLQTGATNLVPENVERFGILLGPQGNRPSKAFLDRQWDTYQFIYIGSDTGERAHVDHEAGGWTTLPLALERIANADLPDATTLPEGYLAHETNRGIPAWNDGDGWEFPVFVDDVKISSSTVVNTTARTSVFNPDINANSLVQGRIYQLDLHGTFETANTSDQFTVDIDIAGTDAASLQNAAENAAAGTPWTLELTFTVRQHGQSGVIKANTRATFNEQPRTSNTAEITLDTTTATQLEVFITWSAADANNSVTVEQAHLKQMG